MSKVNDEMVMKIIRQVISEVKQEMDSNKKILSESKTPQKVFNTHQQNMKKYIIENVMATLRDAER